MDLNQQINPRTIKPATPQQQGAALTEAERIALLEKRVALLERQILDLLQRR